MYCLSAIRKEEEEEKAIDNYLIKYIGANLALLLSLSRT